VQRHDDCGPERRLPGAAAQRVAQQRAACGVLERVQDFVVAPDLRLGERGAVNRRQRENQRRPREERQPASHIFHLPKSSSERFSRNSEYLLVPLPDFPFAPLWPLWPLAFSTRRRSILRARSITLRATRIGACARSASAIASDGRESI